MHKTFAVWQLHMPSKTVVCVYWDVDVWSADAAGCDCQALTASQKGRY